MNSRKHSLPELHHTTLSTRQSKRCVERQPSSKHRELNGKRSRSVTVLRASPYSIRTTCRWSRTIFCAKGRWWSASSGDTGDLIAIWSWRLYKESILKSEHWGQIIVLTPELERYRQALHKKLSLTTFDMLPGLHQKAAEQFRLV